MRTLPLTRFCLLLGLVASAALAREPDDTFLIRTLKVSEHPAQEAHNIYVAGQVVTSLRFEREVNPAKTKLLAWEGRLEPLLVGGKKVVLEAIRDLGDGEAVPLAVTLVDGTEFVFLVRPKSRESYGAVLSSLDDSLKPERKLGAENERFKKEENSVDHAYATLALEVRWCLPDARLHQLHGSPLRAAYGPTLHRSWPDRKNRGGGG